VSKGASWSEWLSSSFDALDEASLRRKRKAIKPIDATQALLDEELVTLYSGNDYLGLSSHPAVRAAAAEAAHTYGLGPRGSALICGYTDEHSNLEKELASLKGADSAVLMPTGYASNLSVLQSLAGEGVTIYSDALNHASIVDGCRLARLSGAKVHIYRHGDAGHLEDLLSRCDAERRVIVTDTVFSMDGDLAPLVELVGLKKKYGALLVVDDAHGTLVHGPTGAGVVEQLGVTGSVDIQVGTLSKAFGALGGFVVASEDWCDWFVNRGRAQIYSTALPLPIVMAARAAIRISSEEPEHRERLWSYVERVGDALSLPASSPIFSWIVGSPSRALEASESLLNSGVYTTAIRPPTVQRGTSRLRITLSAAHTSGDIDKLVEGIIDLRAR